MSVRPSRRRNPRRVLIASVLLAAALAALLGGWFVSGWADVRAREREITSEPVREAARVADRLAYDLRAELSRLLTRETSRSYFHYGNLFHDTTRAGNNWGVAPSPLANGPEDPLIVGHFQIDAAGRVTTPTINDDIPELSEPTNLAANGAFRDEVGRALKKPLTDTATRVAIAPTKRKQPREVIQAPQRPQTVQVDQQSYTTNAMANDVFWQQQAVGPGPTQRVAPQQQRQQQIEPQQATPRSQPQQQQNEPQQATPRSQPQPQPQQRVTPRSTPQPQANPEPPQPQPQVAPQSQPQRTNPEPQVAPPPHPQVAPQQTNPQPQPQQTELRGPTTPRNDVQLRPRADQTIPVTISAFEWRTEKFAGEPALVAVRHIETPDGRLVQGFVVEKKQLAAWLESRAKDGVAELSNTDDPDKPEVVPGWSMSSSASTAAIAASLSAADDVRRGFLIRFIVVGLIAAAAFVFVVMLVARAEKLARERSQFAAAAAHELRTPLAGLQLYGDMMADGLGDPAKQADYARRMSEEASRLGRVVSNVLGFSQLERGNLSIEVRAGDLSKELCQLAERAQPTLDRAGAVLELDVPPDLRASFDKDALARIVGNLIDNAEKYGRDADDRTITLRAAPAKHDGTDCIEIVVTDRGPGVAAEARSNLFKVFARGVGTDGPAGLGLGLALSQSLARAMGGDLDYRPTDGGASFVLRLPPPSDKRLP